MGSNGAIIRIEGLEKEYEGVPAIRRLSFEIGEGDVFGFIGPNGAGKTTTMRILATLLEPSGGEAFVAGRSVVDRPEEVRRLLGYMPDYYGVYEGVTVEEYLDFFAASYHLPRRERRVVVRDVMELTDLTKLARKLVEGLSKGMKQRLCLAKTLVHDPKVLILDEPAAGLDPRARIELRILLKELQRLGKTIMISSHILTELADICNTVGIIERGEILAVGDIETIRRKLLPHRVLTFRILGDAEAIERARLIAAAEEKCASADPAGENALKVIWTGEERDIYKLVRALVDRDIPIVGLYEEKANLEHLFMQITKGELA
jgi:ABC-2 type transport system ATP-binding protein